MIMVILVVILGARIAMPTHKTEVYWEVRSRAHHKDPPDFANGQIVTPARKQNTRIIFRDVDVTFLRSKITTSCTILILHLLHCKPKLLIGDVGLMSHFCVIFVVQTL